MFFILPDWAGFFSVIKTDWAMKDIQNVCKKPNQALHKNWCIHHEAELWVEEDAPKIYTLLVSFVMLYKWKEMHKVNSLYVNMSGT